MEKLRKPVHKKDFQDDLDEYFQKINKMITYDLDNAAVAHIMGMATDRRNVRPPTAT